MLYQFRFVPFSIFQNKQGWLLISYHHSFHSSGYLTRGQLHILVEHSSLSYQHFPSLKISSRPCISFWYNAALRRSAKKTQTISYEMECLEFFLVLSVVLSAILKNLMGVKIVPLTKQNLWAFSQLSSNPYYSFLPILATYGLLPAPTQQQAKRKITLIVPNINGRTSGNGFLL